MLSFRYQHGVHDAEEKTYICMYIYIYLVVVVNFYTALSLIISPILVRLFFRHGCVWTLAK